MKAPMKSAMIAIAIGLALLGAGCAQNKGTMAKSGPPAQPNPKAQMQVNVVSRMDALRERAAELSHRVALLPGRTDEEQRAKMQEVFEDLSEILPMLQGPYPGG